MTSDIFEKLAIREVIENWVVWRDAGDWERFRTVWHDDGRMMATWFQGTAEEFIRVSREGFELLQRCSSVLGLSDVGMSNFAEHLLQYQTHRA